MIARAGARAPPYYIANLGFELTPRDGTSTLARTDTTVIGTTTESHLLPLMSPSRTKQRNYRRASMKSISRCSSHIWTYRSG